MNAQKIFAKWLGKQFAFKPVLWLVEARFSDMTIYNIACCNDGVRPVVFRLEMIEDDEKHPFE